jgi:hypothetical protein
MAEYIERIRAGLVCDRCGRYVGSLAATRYQPPPYPVAFEDISADDEAHSLVQFEWHILGMMRQGRFVIRHPEKDGVCVSMEEWAREEDEDEDDEEGEDGAEAE